MSLTVHNSHSRHLEPVVPIDLDLALCRGEVAERVAGIVETVEERRRQGKADSTLRSYESDWRCFKRWCKGLGVTHLPAGPAAVAAYAGWMSNPEGHRPYAVSTIGRHLAAIAWYHRQAGYPTPCDSEVLREVMAGNRRTLGVAPVRKRAISTEDLRSACADMGDRLIDVRDRAVLLVGYAGGFRRSELAALNLADATEGPDGLSILVAKAKGDQEGRGRRIGIVYGKDPVTCPVRALRTWINTAGIAEGALFRRMDRHGRVLERLSPRAVAIIVKRHMARLGHDVADFAGHSLRRGMATTAAHNGADDRTIMATTRHASPDSLTPYIEEGRLFHDPASGYLGL